MQRKLDRFGYLVGTTIVLTAFTGLVVLCWRLTPLLLYGVHIVWSIAAFSLMALVFGVLIVMLRVLHQEHFEDR